MVSAVPDDRLFAIADHPLFIAGAYFVAFFPWGIMSNMDFISEKWRTIKRTRKLARWHMWCSILPMFYVGVYAEAQRRKGDWKECCAALVALGYNLTHFLRTLVGSTQLNAFVTWCTDAIECMRIIQGRDVAGDVNRKRLWGVAESLTFWRKWIRNRNDGDEGSEGYNREAEVEVDVLDKLMVNNTIVDNELEGTEVTVNMSRRKVWEGLKKREWNPSSWLVTESTSLCTVRWSCAFLCGLGEDWRVGGPYDYLSAETRASFYSDDMDSPLRILQNVTYNIGATENEDLTIFSVSELLNLRAGSIDLPGTAAYGNDLRDYKWRECFTSYTLEFDSLRTSYPSSNAGIIANNRENISVELMELVVIAKHIGFEKLRAMRRCFDRLGPRTDKMWFDSWRLLLEQCDALPSNDSPLRQIFQDLNYIPLFPYRLQMLSLWEESTNWRVLQASAHQDNVCSIGYWWLFWHEKSLFEIEPRPPCVFEYCRERGLSASEERGVFSGVVLETVRSFLANRLVSSSRIPDWEPVISTASIELPISESLLEHFRTFHWEDLRLYWECQRGLQMKLARRTNLHDDITAETEIIMLLLLGLPLMYMHLVYDGTSDDVTINPDGSGDGGISDPATFDAENDTGSVSNYESMDITVQKFRVWSRIAPQNVYIEIRVDQEARKMWLNLVDNTQGGRFMWEEWINAAMGFMKGVDEGRAGRQANNESKMRTIRKADLRKPMVELTPLGIRYNYCYPTGTESNKTGSENGTGTVRLSTGCSTLDVSRSSDIVVDIERSEIGSENGIDRVSTESSKLDVPTPKDTVVDTNSSENGSVKRTVQVWTGWPVFDVRLCKFEVDQWLASCGFDLDKIEATDYHWRIDEEIEEAEKVIRAIVTEIDDYA